MKQESNSNRLKVLLAVTGVGALCFCFFQFILPYHLFLREQTQLFFLTSDYFYSYLSKPAFVSRYIGDFLTQFFYFRLGGPAILAIILATEWLLSYFLLKRITQTKYAFLLAFLIPAADLVVNCELTATAAHSVSLLFLMGSLLVRAAISQRFWRHCIDLLLTFGGYFLFGIAFAIYPLLAILYRSGQSLSERISLSLLAILALAIPAFSRIYFLLPLTQAYIYPANSTVPLLLPAFLLVAAIIVLTLNQYLTNFQTRVSLAIPLFTVLLIGWGLALRLDLQLERMLALDSEYYFGNYEQVLELAERHQSNNRASAYFVNLSLAQQEQLSAKLLHHYQPGINGLAFPVQSGTDWLTVWFSNEFYFLVGDMALAQHAAMLANTFSPNQRSARMVKRLAEINLINGDYDAANKFLSQLKNTLFHRAWAERRTPGNFNQAFGHWLAAKQQQVPLHDKLFKPHDFLSSLEFTVQEKASNRSAREYLLCFYLLNKDLERFKQLWDSVQAESKIALTELYSEALLIKLYQEKASPKTLSEYRINPEKVKQFAAYTQLATDAQHRESLRSKYGNTYWFYYQFAKMKDE